jgi:membrane associated rhomboid family serine protease
VLLSINIIVFILVNLIEKIPWSIIFGLVPDLVFGKVMLWQLFTYMFVHFGLWHLVINMLMLWFFGPALENTWGSRQFLSFYFFTGIGAALCSFIVMPSSHVPVVGASGAIFGILVAYAIIFPETVIYLFFIFPMKIRHAVIALIVINLLGTLSSPGSGIAYFAHLGGGLFGYLYVKNEWIRSQVLRMNPAGLRAWREEKKKKREHLEQKKLDEEVDVILDKIYKHGVESLTEREKKILEKKRQQ